MLATFAAYLAGITFEDYFVRRYGLTKDLEGVRLYYQALKDTKPPGSLDDIRKLSKIFKFDWEKYYNKPIKMKVQREKTERNLLIMGFLNDGKILLQDNDNKNILVEANPDEIIKILQ